MDLNNRITLVVNLNAPFKKKINKILEKSLHMIVHRVMLSSAKLPIPVEPSFVCLFVLFCFVLFCFCFCLFVCFVFLHSYTLANKTCVGSIFSFRMRLRRPF